jgi:hypothetical protein
LLNADGNLHVPRLPASTLAPLLEISVNETFSNA